MAQMLLQTQPAQAVASSDEHSNSSDSKSKKTSVLKAFLAGSISGCCSALLLQPLDLIKTRLQTLPSADAAVLVRDDLKPRSSQLVRPRGIVQVAWLIVQTDSVFALWKGLIPTLYRTVPGVGIYFSTLHFMKSGWATEPTYYENLCLGFAARTVAGVTLLPVTVIKARFESGHFNYTSVPNALLTIWRLEGVRGLFSGCAATIARDSPFSGLYLMFYTQGKKIIETVQDRPIGANVRFGVGICSGLMASLLTQPADVIKTQMQLYPSRYVGTVHCLRAIVGDYGIRGLFRGMLPRCLRRALMSALSWTVFEELMSALHLKV